MIRKDFDITIWDQIIDGGFIGYHHDITKFGLKRDDIITIRKGTKYHSSRYGYSHDLFAGKTYKVKVNHLLHGAQWEDKGKIYIYNTKVVWVGSGGYWQEADINDVLSLRKRISIINMKDFITKEEMKI